MAPPGQWGKQKHSQHEHGTKKAETIFPKRQRVKHTAVRLLWQELREDKEFSIVDDVVAEGENVWMAQAHQNVAL